MFSSRTLVPSSGAHTTGWVSFLVLLPTHFPVAKDRLSPPEGWHSPRNEALQLGDLRSNPSPPLIRGRLAELL